MQSYHRLRLTGRRIPPYERHPADVFLPSLEFPLSPRLTIQLTASRSGRADWDRAKPFQIIQIVAAPAGLVWPAKKRPRQDDPIENFRDAYAASERANRSHWWVAEF